MHNETRQVLDFLDSATKSFAQDRTQNDGFYRGTGDRLRTGALAALVSLGIAISANLEKLVRHLDSIQDTLSDVADSIAVIESRTDDEARK